MAVFQAGLASGFRLETRGTEVGVSVDNNQTRIRYELVVVKFGSGTSHRQASQTAWRFFIDDTKFHEGTFSYDFGLGTSEKVLLTAEMWIEHNSDGTKTLDLRGEIDATVNIGGPATAEGMWTLTPIARATVPWITGGSHHDAGTQITINLPEASEAFTHTIRYDFEGLLNQVIVTKTTSKPYLWTIPVSLLTRIPNKLTGFGTIWVDTYNGTTLIGTKGVQFAAKVPASGLPVVTGLTWQETVASAVPVGAIVQGISKPLLTMTGVAGYQGSTIVSASIVVAGMTLNGQSGTVAAPFIASGVIPATLTVVDSRGRSGTAEVNLTVVPYASPAVSASVERIATNSVSGTPSDSGIYIRVNLSTTVQSILVGGVQKNTASYQVEYRPYGSSVAWTTDKATTARVVPTDTTAYMSTATLAVDASREYRITVSDRFGAATPLLATMSAALIMHLDGSAGVGIRKKRERGALDVLGDAFVSGNIFMGAITNKVLAISDYVTKAVAEAGTQTTGVMTPLRVAEAIAAKLLAHKGVAFAVAGGIVNVATAVQPDQATTATITFPAGKFTQPPILAFGPGNGRFIIGINSITATSAVVSVNNWSPGGAIPGDIRWIAYQATSAASAG